jgi:hypothetical protein
MPYFFPNLRYVCSGRKSKAIRVTGCETSRLPHFVDNRLTDGGEVVSLMHQEESWYPFLLEAEWTPGP